jgi:uncharacterized protein YjbI with pentapeptide repeats
MTTVLLAALKVLIVAALVLVILWRVPRWQANRIRLGWSDDDLSALEPKDRLTLDVELANAENAARGTLTQFVGGLALLAGLYFTAQNLQLTQDTSHETLRTSQAAQIAERFDRAIKNLSEDTKFELVVGGIYSLEGLARDWPQNGRVVLNALAAYIRRHAKRLDNRQTYDPLPAEVQMALAILGDRDITASLGGIPAERQIAAASPLDLSGVDIFGAKLNNSRFVNVSFAGSQLGQVRLERADLRRSSLHGAQMEHARLNGADLRGADLSYAHLTGAQLAGVCLDATTKLFRADLTGAVLDGADLRGVDLRGVIGTLEWQQVKNARFDKTSKFPDGVIADLGGIPVSEHPTATGLWVWFKARWQRSSTVNLCL